MVGPKGHESFILDPLSPDEDLLNCKGKIVVTNCVKNTPKCLKGFFVPIKEALLDFGGIDHVEGLART